MLQFEIHIPRPLLTLCLFVAVGALVWSHTEGSPADAMGGDDEGAVMVVHDAEQDIRRLREQQSVLDSRERILRAELDALESELSVTQDQKTAAALVATREELLLLMNDRRSAEKQILTSLQQIWEAQGIALRASQAMDGTLMPSFEWPVEATLGVSAHFHDASYKKRFGMEHEAIDIPVLQGSPIYAAAPGAVVKVSDNGKGYNSIVISHEGHFSTLYGHVSSFLVKEGDVVFAGEPIALSGGTPGTNGAGRMTTGAHLHFEMLKDGQHVDPLLYLPAL